jgi:hypothetical protein
MYARLSFASVTFVAASLILATINTALPSEDIRKFFGTWVASSQNGLKCKKIDGEIGGFAIGQDKYIPYLGGYCDNVKTFMQGGSLKVSANCVSVEGGSYSAITNEFELTSQSSIRVISATDTNGGPDPGLEEWMKKQKFVRCADCGRDELNCIFGAPPRRR